MNAWGSWPPDAPWLGSGSAFRASDQAASSYCGKSVYKTQRHFHQRKIPGGNQIRRASIVCAAECTLWSVVLPRCPKAAPGDAPASAPLLRPRCCGVPCGTTPSRDSWITRLQTATPCKHLSRWGGAERGFFLVFFFFSKWQQAAASSTLAPGYNCCGPLLARLLWSVRNADPLDIVISVNICRCFRAGTCVWPGMPARLVAFLHGIPSLQRKREMILMDHSG